MHVLRALGTKRLLIAGVLSTLSVVAHPSQVREQAVYRPTLAVSDAVEPFLKQLEPGNDAFPLERWVQELDARLRELSNGLRAGPARAAAAALQLLGPG